LEEYRTYADTVEEGFKRAARLLHGQKFFAARDLPYRTQLTPMATVLALVADPQAENVRSKLNRWYWCGVFGELYGGSIETRFARDVPELLRWLDGGDEPSTVTEANFQPHRLLSMRTRNSAAYKGLHALMLRDGCQDWRSGEAIDERMYFDEKIDIHHIFPQDWCLKHGIDAARRDSIVNKTPLDARTNRIIGGEAPSAYLPKIQKRYEISDERLSAMLRTHVIDEKLLRSDDFDSFFAAREAEIVHRIETAMGKKSAETDLHESDEDIATDELDDD
jgi:hypothetical protein